MFVLTNDDGVDAPGLAALERAVLAVDWGRLSRDRPGVTVVAPARHESGCSHQVTTDRHVRVHSPAASRLGSSGTVSAPATVPVPAHAVEGLPADCVRLAIHTLARDVEWVLSGVNAGGNLGTDVYYSGTVAAVREAALHGLRGIAFSHYIARGRSIDWVRTTRWTTMILERLLVEPLPPRSFWNVNFPHLAPEDPDPAVIECPLDLSPLPLNFRTHETDPGEFRYSGDYQSRPRITGGDVFHCFGGAVTLTRFTLPWLE